MGWNKNTEETNNTDETVNTENVQTEETEAAAQENEYEARIREAEKQRDEYLDSLRRAQADFANYKRHNERARTDGYEDGNREAIAAVLPVIDNLERAIDAAEKSGQEGPLVEGVRMTLKAMLESLAKRGMEEIPSLGEMFDPELHNAVTRGEGEGEPGTIIEVYQKGYRVKNKIIRYAMVKVLGD
ncbi:MAG: nucleotide exchange factor GrpE [Clostridiales bacterium]|nr:nucleotide exchange factor GrpE [Clostridiales bacterium]